jgi:hypothetical protein
MCEPRGFLELYLVLWTLVEQHIRSMDEAIIRLGRPTCDSFFLLDMTLIA